MSKHVHALEALFRDALGAPLTGVLVVTDFASAEKTLPCITLKAALTPLAADFSAFTYMLTATVESTADGATPLTDHYALVSALGTALVGTGKPALMAAMNGVGTYALRGWTAEKAEPSIEHSHFATPIAIGGTALVI